MGKYARILEQMDQIRLRRFLQGKKSGGLPPKKRAFFVSPVSCHHLQRDFPDLRQRETGEPEGGTTRF